MAQADAVQAATQRLRVRVRGAVQGVGFRPFVYDLATRMRLDGFVKNDAAGVLFEVQGERVAAFLESLSCRPPPLARVDAIDVEEVAPRESSSFVILDSVDGRSETRIVPDAAVCEDCLDDLFDPTSRFYLYPFVTCTHCGPRYTLTRRLPYDRARTSMAPFAMCPDCARDYRDPANRRFHAEPLCCSACGPKLSSSPAEIVAALRAGKIVSTKGIGGFHLMCDARNRAAVEELRRRKARDAKPFAVMAANVSSVATIARATEQELALLQDVARPIVLTQSRGVLADAVAPRLNRIGVMLPYTPLHHLIFHAAAGAPVARGWRDAPQELVLVATSANFGGDPLVKDNEEAQERLAAIADLIVTHDREIVTRVDDSVMSVVAGAPAFLRRARGFAPEPIELGGDGPCVVAAGAHLKATITVTRGREAFVSQHIGDLSNAATGRFYRETAQRLIELLDVTPQLVACDLHPDYHSTRWAEELGLPLVRAQHHAAHLAAILAEHRIEAPALGLALDGHGLGDAGQSWGGELMRLDGASWRRLGGLAPLPAPGGERAAREPWRMGVGALAKLRRLDEATRLFADEPRALEMARLIDHGYAPPATSSMGRLFDAAAALLGLSTQQRYEAQAAMEMEALVNTPRVMEEGFRLLGDQLDFSPLLGALADGRMAPREGAEFFHGTLIEGLAQFVAKAATAQKLDVVALGGGCMMNRILAEGLTERLQRLCLRTLLARKLPPNDGGLSLGQAAMARAFAQSRIPKEIALCV
ncbi:carbamoyltransferase HypF [Methylocystis sp. FS]|uniref:carbamoyltransferase HypF n=1 Tax=Methylocystis silviterrae TaxID=2743612 RepID=UPI0015828E02|nr:carbamoyltransferase HypF [Methylocystis silviterrae]NUJ79166.1 carbamoyltransferase HypF [Methylocystis silviterrae]